MLRGNGWRGGTCQTQSSRRQSFIIAAVAKLARRAGVGGADDSVCTSGKGAKLYIGLDVCETFIETGWKIDVLYGRRVCCGGGYNN